MRVQFTASLAAGASVVNVLAGTQLELINRPSIAKFGITGSAAGLLASVYSGADTLMEESAVAAANRMPIEPDDFFKDVAAPGDRLKVGIRNPTAGALTYFVVVETMPLRA
jgi:hypothetical protein